MPRKFRIVFILLPVLLFGAFFVHSILIPQLGPGLLRHVFSKWGIAADIRGIALVSGSMKVESAELTRNQESASHSSLKSNFSGLQLVASFNSLRQGRLSSVSAESAHVEITAGGAIQEKSPNVKSIWEIASKMFPPLHSAQVKKLSFIWQDPASGKRMTAEGHLSLDDSTFVLQPGATLSFTSPDQPEIQAELLTAMKLARSPDEKEIALAPFSLLLNALSVGPEVILQAIELKSERLVLMAKGASGKVSVKGEILVPNRPELQIGPLSLGAEMQILPDSGLIPRAEFEIQVAKLNLGLPMSNLRARLRLVPQNDSIMASTILLHEANVGVFNGSVKATSTSFKLNDRNIQSTVTLSALNLQQLFELYPDSKITGSGLIDGTVKLNLRDRKSITAQGSLTARPPGGVLKSDLSAWASAHPDNKGIALTTRALQNFQYSTLTSTVEYSAFGQLLLSVVLKGSNPDLNQSQPINLNVNVEENLPALFESLRTLKKGPAALIKAAG